MVVTYLFNDKRQEGFHCLLEELDDIDRRVDHSHHDLLAFIAHALDQLFNDHCETMNGRQFIFLVERKHLLDLDIS